jgi:hypothetical protein
VHATAHNAAMGGPPMLRYLLRAFSGPPLLLTAVVCVLLVVARAAGLMGLPLDLVLVAWVWSYAYLLVDYTARGLPPPVLSIEMTNPLHEPRPLLQILLIIAASSFIWWLEQRGSHGAAVVVGVLMIALFPASLALLAIDGSVARAVWPPALLAVVRGLGFSYLWLIVATLAVTALLVAGSAYLAPFLWYGLVQLCLFALACVLGGAVYERRAELGLEAWEAPERQAALVDAAELKARNHLVDEVYALVRVRDLPAAWRCLDVGLGSATAAPELYRWYRDRTARWEDRRIADRLTSELVARLIALGRRGEAVHEVEAWWRIGGAFVSCTQRDLDVLKRAADELGHAHTLERLAAEQSAAAAKVEKTTADDAS